ncbi:hypothetical protein BBJ28_00013162 [Nothophytophthora sp. Chile5]|nr:hypothetical protein BBJ28_00013162 [Nothophytophthora sp. Chile5]
MLPDLAVLASLSVAVHYMLGLYGLAGALLLFAALEHGAAVLAGLRGVLRPLQASEKSVPPCAWRWSASPASDDDGDASTEGDEAPEPALEAADDPEQASQQTETTHHEEEEDEAMTAQRRRARQLISRLIVRDVGSRTNGSEPSLNEEDEDGDTRNEPLKRMEMNSRSPIAFETELFVGHALFLVRTQPEDPYYSELFVGKRRMFWIQVQGRFKQPPQGTVYLGGELPARIAPGVFTRSVALVIMGLIRRLVGAVTFSFGSSGAGGSDEELPAVAFPLYQSVDQFVETPEGQTPPPLGRSDFGESEEAREKRRHTPLGTERYEMGATYSFHFHTMYVDLTRWETANLPSGLNAMDLASFFDSLPLRLVAYDVRSSAVGAEPSDSHRQRDKAYLFSFEVQYNHHGHHEVEGEEEEEGGAVARAGGRALTTGSLGLLGLLGSEISTMSTNVSDASSLTEEDPALAQEQEAFVRRENARRLSQLSFSFLCWLEEVDVASDVRRVLYVFAVSDKDELDTDEGEEAGGSRRHRLAIVSSYSLRMLLQTRYGQGTSKAAAELAKLRFHSRSRIGSYSTISSEAQQVAKQLQLLAMESLPPSSLPSYSTVDDSSDTDTLAGDEDGSDELQSGEKRRLIAAQAALYKSLTKRPRLQETRTTSSTLSPSRLGVNLSRRDREDLGVVFEGVVYRYYAATLLRQEVLLLTKDMLLFYRSYASSPDKQVPCTRVIGARAVAMPCAVAEADGAIDGAFGLQIRTFAEEIVLCVGTAFARDAWVRGILQHCDPSANFARSLQGEMYICFAASSALRPANRVELNSRSLFPQLQQTRASADDEESVVAPPTTVTGALELVKRTLQRALHILNNAQKLSVTHVLAFLDDASALRAVDLQLLHEEGSHEQQLAFYLNLYHAVLAHAMIAHGFPRGKGQWTHFLTRMCYGLRRGAQGEQLSLSLAEIEHVILRARMPKAELPHLKLKNVLTGSSRLEGLGLSHPDFRVSLALVLNHSNSEEVAVFEPESVHDQLNAVLSCMLQRSSAHSRLEVREASNVIVLPRIFEWYRQDFGRAVRGNDGPEDAEIATLSCVRKLLGFMDEQLQHQVLQALGRDDVPLRTQFSAFKYTPKATLTPASSHCDALVEDEDAVEPRRSTTQL